MFQSGQSNGASGDESEKSEVRTGESSRVECTSKPQFASSVAHITKSNGTHVWASDDW